MKKLLLLFFLLGSQLISAQASHISWEFKGGRLLNNPDGTSTGPGPEPAGLDVAALPSTPITLGRLRSAVLGDLDGDDDLDFISGSQGGTVHFFENTGTVTAPNWVAASIPTLDTIWIDRDLTSRNQNRPQLVDIDDDDDLDLLIGTDYDYEGDRNNDILFYRNIGTPETPVFEYIPDGLPGLNNQEVSEFPGLGFVDLDNDTDLDLVALGGDKLTYYKNIGDRENPVFELQSEVDSPWDNEDAYTNMDVPIPVFEDFDKDGDFDMFFMIDGGFVRWIENVGTITNPDFASSPQQLFNGELTVGEIGSFPTIDFGDVNGDGLKDAILGSFNVARFAWFSQVPVCVLPDTPTISFTPVTCVGETSTITISGNLNIASTWSIYTDSCGGNLLGTIDTNTGTFEVTPAAPGTTYYIRGEDGDITCIDETVATCMTITIPVNELDDPSFNYDNAIYCTGDSDPAPTITGLTGGTFSSTAGLSINPTTGNIDIANSTPGPYTITYTTAGTCPNSTDTSVTIVVTDDPNFNYNATSYCTSDTNPTPTITGTTGGTFSSTTGLSIDPASGTIDITNSTPGPYVVTYTTAGICPDSSDIPVTIIMVDNPSFNYNATSYCTSDINPTPTITGTTGGTFSSTTGLSIDPATGTIDITNSTPGPYVVTYTTAGICPDSSDIPVTIVMVDDPNFNYDATSYCTSDTNPTPTITGTVGGTFSSTTGLSIDPATGTIDITNSTPGSYTVTYTTTGICPDSSNVDVTIVTVDDPNFNYNATSYCSNDNNPSPTIIGTVGGTFSSTIGLSIDPATGTIDIANSTPGPYVITYTTAGICPDSSNVDVTIVTVDDPNFNYDATSYCSNDNNPTPTITGTTGGIFSSTTGVSIDQNSGVIDLLQSSAGEYVITYTTSGVCPDSSTVTITISALPNIAITNNSPTLTANSIAGATYQWINCDSGASINGATDSTFTPTENGLYAVDVTLNDCTNRSLCTTVDNINNDNLSTVKLYPNPTDGMITVTLPLVKRIIIFNDYGRKVFVTSDTTFDISILKSGLYFMRIETNNGHTIKKIMRN
ncbi:T9SS type A sorting domain-containing protein [Aquimarina sp. AU474]|uniref:T9SS type A sorting domain-containing protein n=1 Tax=Aquimarina sp. AU474 TaxID=2108529 RepID=UPI000D69C472|nr:T9SS type A sorting domain-containing protein [Aquimarina sp. AU474]